MCYHPHFPPFQNISFPFNILITYWLLSGRLHFWQNAFGVAHTLHCSSSERHTAMILDIFRQKLLRLQPVIHGTHHVANALKRKRRLWSKLGEGILFSEESVRTKTQSCWTSSARNCFVTAARYERLIPSSPAHQEVLLVYHTSRSRALLTTSTAVILL